MKITLRACRANVNASAKEMAEFVGVTKETIYNWESGKSAPKLKQMPKVLTFFATKGFVVCADDIIFCPENTI